MSLCLWKLKHGAVSSALELYVSGGGALLTDVMALRQGCTSLEVTSSRRDRRWSHALSSTLPTTLEFGTLDDVTNTGIRALVQPMTSSSGKIHAVIRELNSRLTHNLTQKQRYSTMAPENIAWRTTARWSTLSTVYPEAEARGMAARESELRMVRMTAGDVIQR